MKHQWRGTSGGASSLGSLPEGLDGVRAISTGAALAPAAFAAALASLRLLARLELLAMVVMMKTYGFLGRGDG